MIKNDFYFTLKALFVIFVDQKGKVNFKTYDVTTWERNNCNTYIVRYFKKLGQSDNEIWPVNRI